MKMFKGLTNEPETAFHHIAVLLEAGLIISASGDEECDELSYDVFLLAQQYARAHAMHLRSKEHENAHDYARTCSRRNKRKHVNA